MFKNKELKKLKERISLLENKVAELIKIAKQQEEFVNPPTMGGRK